MKTSLVLIAATALALPVVPAMAQNASVSVPYADLDLSSPEGSATLDKRIDAAARKVCGIGELRTGTRLNPSAARKCVANVDRQVRAQIAAMETDDNLGG